MAFELLMAEPVFGVESIHELIDANPALLEHFPQLADKPAPLAIEPPARRLPSALFPTFLDGAARALGESAWRYMQWTRRHHPDALARVTYVRSTMRPYALFDRARLIRAIAVAIVGITSVLLFAFGAEPPLSHLARDAAASAAAARRRARRRAASCASRCRSTTSAMWPSACSTPCARSTGRTTASRSRFSTTRTTTRPRSSRAASRIGGDKGCASTHVRRGTRNGFKAGALAHGLTLTERAVHRDLRRGLRAAARLSSAHGGRLRRSDDRLRPGAMGSPRRGLLVVHAAAGAGDRLPLPGRAGRAIRRRLLHQLHRHRRRLAARQRSRTPAAGARTR